MKIVISSGDCNGIGIEVMLKSIIAFDDDNNTPANIEISIAGNTETIKEYISAYNLPVLLESGGMYINERFCKIYQCSNYSPVEFGAQTKSAGALAAEAIEIALAHTMSGEYNALVTMPVSKSSLYLAGWKYPGHTEMLADRCSVAKPLMILCDANMRVALATIHEPISKVPSLLNAHDITESLSIFSNSLSKDFGIAEPSIAVLGLNPHAGEDSTMGSEEQSIIIPAINQSKAMGIRAEGPFPADGFFAHGEYKKFAGILAMYHDQGLIPLKLLAGGAGVNFTAGLPIVRTSPDHGTAFPIAGKNSADHISTLNAINLAIEIANRRKHNS